MRRSRSNGLQSRVIHASVMAAAALAATSLGIVPLAQASAVDAMAAAGRADPLCSLPELGARSVVCEELTGRPREVRSAPAPAAPLECDLVGYDDRCEHWASLYRPGATHGDAEPRALASSPDERTIYVVGNVHDRDNASTDYATVAFDAATGAVRWARHYDGPTADGFDYSHGIAVSPDGSRVFVTGGEGTVAYEHGNFATVAYDAENGEQLWEAIYDHRADGIDLAYDLVVSPDGTHVFVTGQSNGAGSNDDYDWATVAYDTTTGARSWVARYDGPSFNSYDASADLTTSPDGSRVYVTGLGDSGDYITIAYDAEAGSSVWQARRDFGSIDIPASLALSRDGSSLYVTGSAVHDPLGEFDVKMATLRYDTVSGAEVWAREWGADNPGYGGAFSVAVTPDGGRIFVAGQDMGAAQDLEFAVVAYEVDGRLAWERTFSGVLAPHEYAVAVAVAPSGKALLVTGPSFSLTGQIWIVTTSLSAGDGTSRWTARYSADQLGVLGGAPHGLGITSGDGRAIVAASIVDLPQPDDAGAGPRSRIGLLSYDP